MWFYRLFLEEYLFYLIVIDGGVLVEFVEMLELLLIFGECVDVLV